MGAPWQADPDSIDSARGCNSPSWDQCESRDRAPAHRPWVPSIVDTGGTDLPTPQCIRTAVSEMSLSVGTWLLRFRGVATTCQQHHDRRVSLKAKQCRECQPSDHSSRFQKATESSDVIPLAGLTQNSCPHLPALVASFKSIRQMQHRSGGDGRVVACEFGLDRTDVSRDCGGRSSSSSPSLMMAEFRRKLDCE